METTRLQVTCRRFPIDMLRYERCYPATQNDAVAIEESLAKNSTQKITVIVESPRKHEWMIQRWQSFCCDVKPIL